MHVRAVVLSALLVVSLAAGAAAPAAAQEAEGEAYAGTHVEFDQSDRAVVDYTVGGTALLDHVTMESSDQARSDVGVEVGARGITDIAGALIEARSEARASVGLEFASGGEMTVHDNRRGVVQFHANGSDQVVVADLPDDAQAASEGDSRVVVSTSEGEGAFVVVGDGEVVVNDGGNVTAEVESGSQLVYRQYEGERSESDEEAERMIHEGVATAEVYVQSSAEGGQETAVEAVEYGNDTAVEAESESRERVTFTVERVESDGKVVLATVSEEAFETAGSVEVYVDGEAAARADSYGAVEQSTTEGDEPRFYVAQSSSAEATTDVAVGIDHFSERSLELRSGDDEVTATPNDEDTSTEDERTPESDPDTDGGGAGFGPLAALTALGAALLVARRR